MIDWGYGSCLAAVGAGAGLAVAYLGVLWLSARQTVQWRTLVPWGVGMVLRLGHLAVGSAVLIASKAAPAVMLSASAGFIVAFWGVLAIVTYGGAPRRNEPK
jgi:hypothetical protein